MKMDVEETGVRLILAEPVDNSTLLAGPVDNAAIPFPTSVTEQSSINTNHHFTPDQIEAIRTHMVYHSKYVTYLQGALDHTFVLEPKKPKEKIDFLKPKEEKKEPSIEEVHAILNKYFVNHVDDSTITAEEDVQFMSLNSVTEMHTYLQKGALLLKNRNQKTLSLSLYIGKWIRHTKTFYKTDKRDKTWAQYLQDEIHISYPHANKLCELSRCFSKYPKFHQLGIPLNDLYYKRKSIIKYFNENVQFRDYWTK